MSIGKIYVLLKYSSIKSIKRTVAKTNVTIAFFIHLHIVIIRDIKNVRKIMNKKNIFSTENGSYHSNRFYVFVPVDVVKDLGKLEIYFK